MIEAESREEYQSRMEEEEEISTATAYKELKSEFEAIKTMVCLISYYIVFDLDCVHPTEDSD